MMKIRKDWSGEEKSNPCPCAQVESQIKRERKRQSAGEILHEVNELSEGYRELVGAIGFEPMTPCAQGRAEIAH